MLVYIAVGGQLGLRQDARIEIQGLVRLGTISGLWPHRVLMIYYLVLLNGLVRLEEREHGVKIH